MSPTITEHTTGLSRRTMLQLGAAGATAAAAAPALAACGANATSSTPGSATLMIGEVNTAAVDFSPIGGTGAYSNGGQAVYDYLCNIEGNAQGKYAATP